MTTPIRVLVADDEKNLRELLVRELGRKGHEAIGVADGRAALEHLKEDVPDVLLLDMKMPNMEGIEVLRELQDLPEAPQVIVMTGFQEVSTAVEAMKLGAYDYLTKPARIEELEILIRKAAEKGRLMRQNVVMRSQLDEPGYQGIITGSSRMEEVLRLIDRVAPTDSSVLVLGESGTGKELVARASTTAPPARSRRSCPSTAARSPGRCWRASCSAMRRGRSPARSPPSPGSSSWPTAAPCFSTRSARWSRRAR